MIASGLDEWRSQLDKDNFYRNVEGGSRPNAWGERLREEGYVFGSQMVFGSEEARTAFKGVTRLGYTNRSDQRLGTSREEALNHLYEGKKSRGQSVEEGLRQLQVGSRSLSTDLGELNGALERVSEAAGKAGVNTEMARKQFENLWSAGIARGQGAGAIGIASAITETNVSYGRDYAATVNSAQMYSSNFEYRAASMTGQRAMSLRNKQRTNPVAAMQAFQRNIDMGIESSGQITPAMKDWIKSQVEAVGGPDVLRNQPELANVIASDFLLQFEREISDPNAFANTIGQLTGQDFGGNIEMAARFLVEQIGGNTMARQAEKHQMEVGKTDLRGRNADGSKNAGVSTSLEKFSELTHSSRADSYVGRSYQSNAAKSYIKGAEKSGQRDAVIEAMLQHDDLEGVKGNKTHVEVQTKSGGRVMTLEEAIKEFPNQVAAGKVRFMDGDAAGKSVADLSGGKVDPTRDWKSEIRKDTKTGESTKDWEKDHKRADQGGGQTNVRVELTPEAQKLVNAYVVGNDPFGAANANSGGYPQTGTGTGSRTG